MPGFKKDKPPDLPLKDPKALRAIWREEEKKKVRQSKLEEVKAHSSAYDGPETAEEEELQSDWQRLRVTAKIKFPEHLALRFNLSPTQRLIGIAHCLGWNQAKIATASGLNASTVSRHLAKDNVIEFIRAFKIHIGTEDAQQIIKREQFASLEVLRDLRDDTTVSATTRKDIAIWFFEAEHGKSREAKENKGTDIRALTEELAALRKPKE